LTVSQSGPDCDAWMMPSRFGPSKPLSTIAEHWGIPKSVVVVPVVDDVVENGLVVAASGTAVVVSPAVVDGPVVDGPVVVILVVVTVVVVTVVAVVVTVDVVVLPNVPVVVVAVFMVVVTVLVVVVVEVVVVDVDVVEVRVVVVSAGGTGLNSESASRIVVVVVVVVVVVAAQVLKLAASWPHAVRKPPNTMRESSAAETSSKV